MTKGVTVRSEFDGIWYKRERKLWKFEDITIDKGVIFRIGGEMLVSELIYPEKYCTSYHKI